MPHYAPNKQTEQIKDIKKEIIVFNILREVHAIVDYMTVLNYLTMSLFHLRFILVFVNITDKTLQCLQFLCVRIAPFRESVLLFCPRAVREQNPYLNLNRGD